MWTLHDAKNKFSAVVDAALAGAPQAVSRRGQPAVVVIAAARYQELLRRAGGARTSFVDHLLSIPPEEEKDTEAGRAQIRPRRVNF